jgi:GH25 family lysozyme M1 (1,4-beta-N-acetylmuramidase)
MKKQLFIISLLITIANHLVAQTILGIDVSHYQGTINWQQVKSTDSKVFAWSKATDGIGTIDNTFSANMINGSSAGVVMGACHFARPYEHPAVDEANYFLSVAGSYIKAGYLPPALDIEDPSDQPSIILSNVFTRSALTSWVQTWITTVQNATGITPIIYTNGNYAAYLNASLNTYKLWIADPNESSIPQANTGVWSSLTFKQYSWTGSVSGISGAADLDVFNGDLNAFNSLIGGSVSSSAPANDNCSSATLLTSSTSLNYLSNQTVNNATPSGKPKANNDLFTGTPSLDDVWYYFQAAGTSTTITVDPNGSSLDAIIAAYNSCNDNTELNSSDTPGGNGVLSTLTIPTTPGNYYYIRIYDYGAANTTNGGFRIALTHTASTLPDLVVSNPQVSPSSVGMGMQVTASCNTVNQGSNNAGPSVTSIWLSADQTFDASVDTYLGEIAIPALNAGQNSGTLSQQITIPLGPYAGTWYIMFGADGAETVGESNETNNQVFIPITFSNTTSDTPTLTATAGCNGTLSQVNLSWTAVTGAVGYDIYRNNSLYYTILQGSITQYQDNGVTQGTPYTYYVTTTSGSPNSNPQTVTASDCSSGSNCTPITLSSNPIDQTVTAPVTVSFNCSASAGTNISFQWQYSANNGSTWNNISNSGPYGNANSFSLSVYYTDVSMNGYQYRCQLSNDCSSVYTNPATLTVNSPCTQITLSSSPIDQTVTAPITASFSCSASGPNISFQWQYSVDGGNTWNNISNSGPYGNANTFSLSIDFTDVSMNGYQYRCQLSNSCSSVYTNPATLTVNPPCTAITLSANPTDQTITAPTTVSFSCSVSAGTNVSFQWQYSTDGGSTWNNISNSGPYSNANTFSLSINFTDVSMNGYQYRCQLSNACSSIYTSQATLNVKFDLPVNNFQISATSATCVGAANGSINITASQNFNYTATITVKGSSTLYPFTTTREIDNLDTGTYHVCITVEGYPDYQQCYDLKITEPQPLSVYSVINNTNNTVNLSLSGGNTYNIQLNGVNYTTTESNITLPLQIGNNKLTVTTDKLCQGNYSTVIKILKAIVPFPEPFDNTLSIDLGLEQINSALFEVHNTDDGKILYSKQFVNQAGVVQLDLSNLREGVYILHIKLDKIERVFKIIKK